MGKRTGIRVVAETRNRILKKNKMEKTFSTIPKGRLVTIRINSETNWITFHYTSEGMREFYSIPIPEWVGDKTQRRDRPDNWHFHMAEKNWFTESMKNFINENT